MLSFSSPQLPKRLLTLLMILFSLTLSAQDTIMYKNIFVRVYNQDGKKIAKGFLKSVTDSTLNLTLENHTKTIPVSDIALIKTKRSAGNNIGVGAGAGAVIFAGIGAAGTSGGFLSDPGLGAGMGAVAGAPIGALVGGIIAATKKKKTYTINGNAENLGVFAKDNMKH